MQSDQTKVENKKKILGSCEFWKISNSILTVINCLKVIVSSSDKTRLFAMNFAFNSMLDDKGHPYPTYSFSWSRNFVIS